MAVDTIARALAIKAQQGGGSGGTSDYQELTNKPSINGVVLEGNKTSSDLGIETGVTEEQLTQTIAQEAAARQKQDSLLEEEIADKLAPANVKAGDGINVEQSGLDVTISSNIYYYNWGLLNKTSDTSEEGKAFWTSIYNKCLAGEHPIVITTVEQHPTDPVPQYTVQLIGVPTALTEEETSSYEMAYKTAPVQYTNENGSFRWYQLYLQFIVQNGEVTEIGKSEYQNLPLLLDFQTSPYRSYPNNLALSTGNTREFIPTQDYHPATKKYVDDNVKGCKPIYWDGTMDEEGNALAMFQEAYDYYLETGVMKNIQFKKVESNGKVNICPLININVSSTEAAFVFASLNGTPNTYTNPTLKYYNYRFNISDGTLSYRSTVSYDSFEFKVAHVYEGNNVAYGGCLEVDNNNSYTPTSDYHPATKKYVDDIVSTISTLSFQVVTELPTVDIQTNIIYLVPSTTSSEQNVYDEYIYINNAWEKIGSTAIDLSNYLAKDNTTAYTPTGDYNPATKQYVDSSVTNQATTEETISGLKTFTTLPESSVVPTTDNQLVNKQYVDSTLSTALGNINTILATLTTVSEVTE